MWKSILVTAIRILRRNKVHSVVTISSLAVGMACFILFFFSWGYERSFDRFHPDAGRIYRVNRSVEIPEWGSMISDQGAALAPALAREFPEVETATRWYAFPKAVIGRDGGELRTAAIVYAVDDQFFAVFPARFAAGDGVRALENRSSVLISRRTAVSIFGTDDALGKPVKLAVRDNALERGRFGEGSAEGPTWDFRDYTVGAVLPDPPSNTTYAFDILIPIEAAAELYAAAGSESILDRWAYGWATTFARLRREASLPDLARKIDALKAGRTPVRPSPSGASAMKEHTVLVPLVSLHFSDEALVKYLYIFGTIALVVFLLACFNSVNLTVARVFKRSPEIGLRKVVGASRRQLVIQFLGESLLMSLTALALAGLAAGLALPSFRYLSGRGLVVGEIGWGPLAGGLAAIILLTVTIAGGYPAHLLTSIRPADLFAKDRTPRTFRSFLSKSLVFAQFAITGILITMGLVVSRQMTFIERADLGMDVDGIAVIRWDPQWQRRVGGGGSGPRPLDLLKADLLRYPGVADASAISQVPPGIETEIDVKPGGSADSEKSPWRYLSADDDFLDTFGIRLAEGRYFSPDFPSDAKNAAVINETAARLLGPGPAVGKRIQALVPKEPIILHNDYTVIGVVRDFHTRPLHDAMEPLLIIPGESGTGSLAVKLRDGDDPETARFIRARWEAVFPDVPPVFSFLKDDVLRAYGDEERLMALTRAFSGVAVFIGGIGLFGLAAFGTAQKRKEIGIRKVLGASPGRIFGEFFKDFTKPVILSNIAAWPAAYVLAQSWLREFAYRASLPVWVFLAGGAAMIVLSLAAVGGRLYRASRENPVEALRQE